MLRNFKVVDNWRGDYNRQKIDQMSFKFSATADLPVARQVSSFKSSFTLIEIIIIAAVISIIAVIAFLMLPDFQEQRERMAARELMKHLRYIQNITMNRERTTRVVFSVVSNSYTVSITDTNGVYVPAKDPVTQKDWVANIADNFFGVELSSVNINGNNVLYFHETNDIHGIPCDISTNMLTATGTVTFLSGRKVTITPLTGYVRVE